MEALGKRRIPEIARGTGSDVEEAQEPWPASPASPRPGRAFLPVVEQYVAPEVFVKKNGDDFTVTTNDEQISRICASATSIRI